jgi:hypothetical protein
MTGFGDDDPEDGYDEGDPLHARLAVLARVLAAVAAAPEPLSARDLIRLAWVRRKLEELTGG